MSSEEKGRVMGVGTVSGTNILHTQTSCDMAPSASYSMETILGTSLVAPFCHIDRHHALVEERRSSVGHVLSEELQSLTQQSTSSEEYR